MPLLPLVLLFLTGPPLDVVSVPRHWLMGPKDPPDARPDSRLIGVAMLIGVAAAGVVGGRARSAASGRRFLREPVTPTRTSSRSSSPRRASARAWK